MLSVIRFVGGAVLTLLTTMILIGAFIEGRRKRRGGNLG